jgi:hypothetical protein
MSFGSMVGNLCVQLHGCGCSGPMIKRALTVIKELRFEP